MVTIGRILRGNSLIEKTLGFSQEMMVIELIHLPSLLYAPIDKWSKSSPFHGEVSSSNLLGSANVIVNNPREIS